MKSAGGWVWVALGVLALGGCETQPVKEVQREVQVLWRGPGEPDLSAGIQHYENGNHAEAYRRFQASLAKGLHWKSDQVQAYKYLAFIDCASGRERACRDNFVRALTLDPDLELTPSEAGHPIWGPVFRSLKAGR